MKIQTIFHDWKIDNYKQTWSSDAHLSKKQGTNACLLSVTVSFQNTLKVGHIAIPMSGHNRSVWSLSGDGLSLLLAPLKC